MKIGITGATGFVGSALIRRIERAGFESYPLVQKPHGLTREIVVGDLSLLDAKNLNLPKLDVLVHLAARAHVMQETANDPLEEYRRVNVEGTRRVAEAALQAGIERFIFLSSIKVNGERTSRDRPYRETDVPHPEDFYGQSKFEAESVVQDIYSTHGHHWTIVRPPLVYGPGVKGNFKLLMKLATSPIPLPFGSTDNERSMIFLDNLTDFLLCTANDHRANDQIFLISDGVDMSTRELIVRIAEGSQKKPVLISVPTFFFIFLAKIIGRSALADRLFGCLKIDSSKAQRLLNWSPPYNAEEAFRQTVQFNHGS